jgi:N-acetylmuramoyl-L-alanine amidase
MRRHSILQKVFLMGFLALLAAFVLPVENARAEDSPAMTAARINGNEARTRFVADLTQSVSYSVYVLPDPFRVVIDLPQMDFRLPPDSSSDSAGLVRDFRYGGLTETQSRIVIDTDGPVLIDKSFVLKPRDDQPARLVVDMVRASESAFHKAYKAQEGAADHTGSIPRPVAKPGTEEPPRAIAALPVRERRLVVIDPGHGGMDPGAIGVRKTKEKDVVLNFAKALRDAIRAGGKYDVELTREDDRFLTLKDRVKFARERQADLFIAVHADTVRGQSARGATLYTLSDKASDAEAEALAEKENRADIIAGVDLGQESPEITDILIDLVQRESKTHAIFFARKAAVELKNVTLMTGKPIRSAGFVVLKAPDVPSVLIELGYLSSKSDEELLTNPTWHQRTAAALSAAIDRYFGTEIAQRQ